MNILDFIDKFNLYFVLILAMWGTLCNYFIFQKIGYSGVSGMIPIYNSVLLFKRYYGSGWYVLAILMPFTFGLIAPFIYFAPIALLIYVVGTIIICFYFAYGVLNRLRKDFNKSLEWFIVFLCVLPFIGYGILAFGSSLPKHKDYYVDEDKKPLI